MNRPGIRKILLIAALLVVALLAGRASRFWPAPDQPVRNDEPATSDGPATSGGSATRDGATRTESSIVGAIQNRASKTQVEGEGTVVKVLPDDNQGDRHQRFLLKIAGRHQILVAHNIDLAPRIENLQKGDLVQFSGEFEWNDKGGVVHWTHHDPRGKHAGGWLKHQGRSYE